MTYQELSTASASIIRIFASAWNYPILPLLLKTPAKGFADVAASGG
jgi:hypothetical protein